MTYWSFSDDEGQTSRSELPYSKIYNCDLEGQNSRICLSFVDPFLLQIDAEYTYSLGSLLGELYRLFFFMPPLWFILLLQWWLMKYQQNLPSFQHGYFLRWESQQFSKKKKKTRKTHRFPSPRKTMGNENLSFISLEIS